MINNNILDELNRLGIGADVDALESYILRETPETVGSVTFNRCLGILKQLKPSSVVFIRGFSIMEDEDEGEEGYADKEVRDMGSIDGFRREMKEETYELIGMLRPKGMKCKVVYKYGRIINGSVSGGDYNIQRHIRIKLPNYVPEWAGISKVEIRGHITIEKDKFTGGIREYFKDSLNYIDYLLRDDVTDREIEDLEIVFNRQLECGSEVRDVDDCISSLRDCGFKVVGCTEKISADAYSFEGQVERLLNHFEGLYVDGIEKHECDGVLIGLNSLEHRKEASIEMDDFLLMVGKVWERNIYTGVVEGITWENYGEYIRPIVLIVPVTTITGIEITEVPLYNLGSIIKDGIEIGSEIQFTYRGGNSVELYNF